MLLYTLLLIFTYSLFTATMPLYSRLGQNIGSFWASSLYLVTGAITLSTWLLINNEPIFTKDMTTLSPIVYINGLVNILVLMGIVVLIPRVGVAFLWASEVMGQILTALIMDHWMIFSPHQVSITAIRLIAVIFIIVGAIVFTLISKTPKGESSMAQRWPLWLCFIIGVLIGTMQSLMNGINTITGIEIGIVRALVLYFIIGASVSVIIGIVLFREKLLKMISVRPKYHLPGFVNILLVGVPPLVIPVIGISLTTSIGFASAALTTLLIDRVGFLGLPKIPISLPRIIGLLLMFIGVITMGVLV